MVSVFVDIYALGPKCDGKRRALECLFYQGMRGFLMIVGVKSKSVLFSHSEQ